MSIFFHKGSGEFHLQNDHISYIIHLLPNGQPGQLYFGPALPDRPSYGHLLETADRPMSACLFPEGPACSLEHLRQEYPSYGTTDFREPAFELIQPDGSRIMEFVCTGHRIFRGKKPLPGLPATYAEQEDEAETLELTLADEKTGAVLVLSYTIFRDFSAIARSARLENRGAGVLHLSRAMSLSVDLPDDQYVWMQFSGAWSRERHVKKRTLDAGITSVGSLRGHSSHQHNPFVVLARPNTDENAGEAIGLSLVYSGNFLMQAEVDNYGVTRLMAGIHPFGFDWKLDVGESFQTPEAVLVYSAEGLGDMSRTFHRLFRTRLARGYWRDRERPVLINNWEATYFDFTEERVVEIAKKAKELGAELFVLDDGWFGKRNDDTRALGDWQANLAKLPHGIEGLSRRIEEECGMRFGLWFEPEMVSEDSDLFRAHPEYRLETPGRTSTPGRHQFVLDFSRKEVVDCICEQMERILANSRVSYVKWDMNRSITQCYSSAWPADRQGEIFHRYILGVYDLYERLTARFPEILFESCASGGGRFDPGMLYYAPQAWTSDDSDAIERLKIQYGTSFAYPLSSMGAHVSAVPNHQLGRVTPLSTRANAAYFGAFGYELDLNRLSLEEQQQVREQIRFAKSSRKLLHTGSFYRLASPFEGNITAWMVVSEDRREAIIGYYKVLNDVNAPFRRLRLPGLDPDLEYEVEGDPVTHSGLELARAGLVTSDASCGENKPGSTPCGDFWSRLYLLRAVD